ncbi:MAG: glycosyltransferase [Anaerolineales bacterium]
MNDLPLVSVLMPSYNSAEFVSDAIESVLRQTHSNTELIIVDDGSTDGTPSILNELAKEESERLTLIRNQSNAGVPHTWNEALSRARGEFTVPFASDDLLPSRAVEIKLGYMLDRPQVDVLVTDFQLLTETGAIVDGEEKRMLVPQFNRLYRADWSRPYEALLRGNFIPGGAVMLRLARITRDQLRQDPRCPHLSDYDLWLRLSREYAWAYLPEPTWIYRWHGKNLSAPSRWRRKSNEIASEMIYVLSKQLVESQSSLSRELTLKVLNRLSRRTLVARILLGTQDTWRGKVIKAAMAIFLAFRDRGVRALFGASQPSAHGRS